MKHRDTISGLFHEELSQPCQSVNLISLNFRVAPIPVPTYSSNELLFTLRMC